MKKLFALLLALALILSMTACGHRTQGYHPQRHQAHGRPAERYQPSRDRAFHRDRDQGHQRSRLLC